MLGEEGWGSARQCFLPLSAHEQLERGNALILLCPWGVFYFGPAAGMGSEISKKEKQGLSKEKGVALKEFIGNLYLNRQQSLPRDICTEKCEGDAFGQDPG